MTNIALVTDSTCDLAAAAWNACRALVVPLHVTLGDVTYLDGVDLSPPDFYRRFAEAGQAAHSSQPSAGEFDQAYRRLLADYESVVSVHISGRLSGAVESARTAAQCIDARRIHVVDSRQVSVGLGLVVQAAGDAIAAGLSAEAVVMATEAAARKTRVWGVTPSLDVAVKGGRVSPRVAFLADSVNLKPIVAFDEEGAARVDGARLGFLRTIRTIGYRVIRFAGDRPVRAAITHADGAAAAYYLWERLRAALGQEIDIPVVQAGAVITTHVGLGSVAVAVQRLDERNDS